MAVTRQKLKAAFSEFVTACEAQIKIVNQEYNVPPALGNCVVDLWNPKESAKAIILMRYALKQELPEAEWDEIPRDAIAALDTWLGYQKAAYTGLFNYRWWNLGLGCEKFPSPARSGELENYRVALARRMIELDESGKRIDEAKSIFWSTRDR